MIIRLDASRAEAAAALIRESFKTVADDFGLTEANCPKHTAFVTTSERLLTQIGWGWSLYGYFTGGAMIGYASLSDSGGGAFEVHNLCVSPARRHSGIGSSLLERCVCEARALGGRRVELSIIDENAALKEWYVKKGFAPLEAKRFDHLPFTVRYMAMDL